MSGEDDHWQASETKPRKQAQQKFTITVILLAEISFNNSDVELKILYGTLMTFLCIILK